MFKHSAHLQAIENSEHRSFDLFVHYAKRYVNDVMAQVLLMTFFGAIMVSLIFELPSKYSITMAMAAMTLVVVWGCVYGNLMSTFEYYYDGYLDRPDIQKRVRETFDSTIIGSLLLLWLGRMTLAFCLAVLATMVVQAGVPQPVLRITAGCLFGGYVFVVIGHTIATSTPKGSQ